MFQKIAICLDGSNKAELIIPYAIEEAVHFNSMVVLLRVFNPLMHGAISSLSAAEKMQEEIEEEKNKLRSYLDNVARPLRERGINVECVVLQGNAGDEIVSYAHEHEVGLIAIATEKRHGLLHDSFGSTADFILKEAHIPVLLIKPEH